MECSYIFLPLSCPSYGVQSSFGPALQQEGPKLRGTYSEGALQLTYLFSVLPVLFGTDDSVGLTYPEGGGSREVMSITSFFALTPFANKGELLFRQ